MSIVPPKPGALLAALLIATQAWCPAAAQQADSSLLEQARAAARENRNRESADLFARAIAADAAQRDGLLQEYADQLTYSDRSRQAVPLYRERLAEVTDPAEKLRLLKGLALALLWSDRPGEAARVYDDVIAIAPGDADAQRNRARALAWSARPRAAVAALDARLAQDPGDADARRLLGEVRGWLGRPDLALATIAPLDDAASAALRRRLRASIAPTSVLEYADSNQSDRLGIRQASLEQMQPLLDGRAAVGLRFDRLRLAADDGSRRIDLDRPLAIGRVRFNDAWELNTRVGSDRIRPDDGPGRSRFVHATWLTWWPNDLLRFDLSAGRSTFDSLRALDLGLTANTVGLSGDVTPNERQRASLRLERANFSDGNRRDRVQALAEQRVSLRLGAWVGARWTHLEFEELLDNGYFNPRRLDSPQLTFRMSPRGPEDRRWDVSLDSAWGREYTQPSANQPAWDFGLTGGLRLAEGWRLQAGWRRFSTRTSALNGFERTTASMALQGRW